MLTDLFWIFSLVSRAPPFTFYLLLRYLQGLPACLTAQTKEFAQTDAAVEHWCPFFREFLTQSGHKKGKRRRRRQQQCEMANGRERKEGRKEEKEEGRERGRKEGGKGPPSSTERSSWQMRRKRKTVRGFLSSLLLSPLSSSCLSYLKASKSMFRLRETFPVVQLLALSGKLLPMFLLTSINSK